jgi:flagellar biosynthesis chaperone FliJ
VSQQLDVLCDSSPVLAPARLKKLRKLLQAAAVREADLREQLSCSRAEVERLQQQLKEVQGGSCNDTG